MNRSFLILAQRTVRLLWKYFKVIVVNCLTKPSSGTKNAVPKLPFRCAPFYGNLAPTYFAADGGVMRRKTHRNCPLI